MNLFNLEEQKKRAYVRDTRGRFCTQSEAKVSQLKKENIRLMRRITMLEIEVEKYYRMYRAIYKSKYQK